LVLLVLKILVI